MQLNNMITIANATDQEIDLENEIDQKISLENDAPIFIGDGEPYKGDYIIRPEVHEQIMPTKSKLMTDNVTVLAIPYFETSNQFNGETVIIGGLENGN